MKGYMYILECADGMYYTGSTKDLDRRIIEHEVWDGARFTRDRLPVKLVYFEEFDRIDEAYYRENQIKKWSRKKKEALIAGKIDTLKNAAECQNISHHRRIKDQK